MYLASALLTNPSWYIHRISIINLYSFSDRKTEIVLEAMKSWAGPGNEATLWLHRSVHAKKMNGRFALQDHVIQLGVILHSYKVALSCVFFACQVPSCKAGKTVLDTALQEKECCYPMRACAKGVKEWFLSICQSVSQSVSVCPKKSVQS